MALEILPPINKGTVHNTDEFVIIQRLEDGSWRAIESHCGMERSERIRKVLEEHDHRETAVIGFNSYLKYVRR